MKKGPESLPAPLEFKFLLRCDVDFNAWSHRRRDEHRLHKLTFGRARFRTFHRAENRFQVVSKFGRIEARFANRCVNHTGFVVAEFDLSSLNAFDDSANV
jgi:hypothetical protein